MVEAAAAATAPPRRDRRESSLMDFSPLAVLTIESNLERIIRWPLRIVHKSALELVIRLTNSQSGDS